MGASPHPTDPEYLQRSLPNIVEAEDHFGLCNCFVHYGVFTGYMTKKTASGDKKLLTNPSLHAIIWGWLAMANAFFGFAVSHGKLLEYRNFKTGEYI